MSVTYGYDLEDGDKMIEAPEQLIEIMSPFVSPGALVNHLPFCTFLILSFHMISSVSQSFQCSTFLPGSHTSATNLWYE